VLLCVIVSKRNVLIFIALYLGEEMQKGDDDAWNRRGKKRPRREFSSEDESDVEEVKIALKFWLHLRGH
jgi:hypothetical protein